MGDLNKNNKHLCKNYVNKVYYSIHWIALRSSSQEQEQEQLRYYKDPLFFSPQFFLLLFLMPLLCVLHFPLILPYI